MPMLFAARPSGQQQEASDSLAEEKLDQKILLRGRRGQQHQQNTYDLKSTSDESLYNSDDDDKNDAKQPKQPIRHTFQKRVSYDQDGTLEQIFSKISDLEIALEEANDEKDRPRNLPTPPPPGGLAPEMMNTTPRSAGLGARKSVEQSIRNVTMRGREKNERATSLDEKKSSMNRSGNAGRSLNSSSTHSKPRTARSSSTSRRSPRAGLYGAGATRKKTLDISGHSQESNKLLVRPSQGKSSLNSALSEIPTAPRQTGLVDAAKTNQSPPTSPVGGEQLRPSSSGGRIQQRRMIKRSSMGGVKNMDEGVNKFDLLSSSQHSTAKTARRRARSGSRRSLQQEDLTSPGPSEHNETGFNSPRRHKSMDSTSHSCSAGSPNFGGIRRIESRRHSRSGNPTQRRSEEKRDSENDSSPMKRNSMDVSSSRHSIGGAVEEATGTLVRRRRKFGERRGHKSSTSGEASRPKRPPMGLSSSRHSAPDMSSSFYTADAAGAAARRRASSRGRSRRKLAAPEDDVNIGKYRLSPNGRHTMDLAPSHQQRSSAKEPTSRHGRGKKSNVAGDSNETINSGNDDNNQVKYGNGIRRHSLDSAKTSSSRRKLKQKTVHPAASQPEDCNDWVQF